MKKLLLLYLLFVLGSLSVSAQITVITGTVTSSIAGEGAIPGVAVQVKGTTTGVMTDVNGKYSVTVPQGSTTLVFTFLGMKPQEILISGRAVIDIVMEPQLVAMGEIVVTALGISREKKALGYSVQDVKSDEIARSGENDVINSLAAKVAGVQVINTAGTPGASTKILIRGNSSFTGNNQPLIVLDGIPIDNSTNSTVGADYPFNPNLQGVNNSNRAIDINPDDIESITVLKGATAAALYGARAANGAILYTTKRGTKGGAPKVVYEFGMDFNTVNKLPDEQKIYVQGDIIAGVPTYRPGATPNSWGPKYTDASLPTYDNPADFFETGMTYSNNLSVSNGDDKNSFRVSIGRLDQSGIIPTSELSRTSVRFNGDSKLTDALTLSASMTYTNINDTKVQNGSNVSGIMLPLMRAPVSFRLSDYQNPDGSSNNYYPFYDNPYWSLQNNPFTSTTDRFIGSVLFTYKISSWLSASYRLGADAYADKRKQIFAIGSNAIGDLAGQIEENTIRSQEFYQDFIVTASHKFFESLNTDLKVGGNLQQSKSEYLYGRANQLNIPNFYNLSNGTTLFTNQNQTTVRTSALFFAASLAWNNYLFVDITGRNEWSSTFGLEQNNFFYPSVGSSFIFSEILPKSNILSFAKLRASLAYGGNSPAAYSSATYYTQPFFADGFTNGTSFPFLGVTGFSLSNVLGNSALKPEQTKESEIGVDIRFFEDRIGLDLTYYRRIHSDLLVLRPIPGSSGFQAINANSGSMRNQGVELVLNIIPLKYRGGAWKVDLTFAQNVNEVLTLAEGVDEISVETGFTGIGSYAIVGEPYGVFYGNKWLRNANGDLIISQSGGNIGLPLQDPLSGNLGNPYPDWTAGIRNTLTFKGLSLSALLDIRQGGNGWCGTIARMNRLGKTEISGNREGSNATYLIDGVADDGTENPTSPNTQTVSALSYFQNFKGDGAFSATENAIYSTAWVRLRELSLTYRYDLKSNWFRFVEINLIGRNLWLNTDYPGVDPETSLTGAGSNLQGFDYFNNPSTRSFSLGLRFGLL